MKSKILTLLRERKDYISGQELCQYFGVSRTAVWKAVNQLKKEGHEIEAVQNRGYRLIEKNEVYGINDIASRMQTKWAGRNLKFYSVIDSTNIQAKKEAEAGAPHGTLVVTDLQTAGRGRWGRGWESPSGTNIYFTLLLRPTFEPSKAAMLTLVMATAVAKAITLETGLKVGIKWPNDIVVNGKKVCGILTEMSTEPDYIHYIVIGAGINVGKQKFSPEIEKKATSLVKEKGKKVSRSALLVKVMECFEEDYDLFLEYGDMTGLQGKYQSMLVNQDKTVCVLDPKGEYQGIARGIAPTGELLVEREDGQITKVYAGEVSVRGIYGYV